MIFVIGSFIGIILFMEIYPLIKTLYMASNLGIPRLYETLGMSQNVFAFIMVIFALATFLIVSIVENKVNGVKKPIFRFTPYYISIAVIGIFLAASAFAFPERKAALTKLIENEEFVLSYELAVAEPDEFAICLLKTQDCDKLEIFDFRSEEEYRAMSLPKSVLFTFDNMFEKEPNILLNLKHKEKIFIANDELTERKMAIVATELGYKGIHILRGGLDGFKRDILNFIPFENPQTIEEEYINRFRTKAQKIIPVLIENNKPKGPIKKKLKRVIGGC